MRVLLTFLLLITVSIAGDRRPAPKVQMPKAKPDALVPLEQRDSFSCGFLALSAIYKSYGVDGSVALLRPRLGTARPAIPFVKDTRGTIQPDIFRVLKQDGFKAETVRAKKKLLP